MEHFRRDLLKGGEGGQHSHIEIQESIDELLRHPDHKDGMDELWDFRKASMTSFNEKEFRNLADIVQERLPKEEE